MGPLKTRCSITQQEYSTPASGKMRDALKSKKEVNLYSTSFKSNGFNSGQLITTLSTAVTALFSSSASIR